MTVHSLVCTLYRRACTLCDPVPLKDFIQSANLPILNLCCVQFSKQNFSSLLSSLNYPLPPPLPFQRPSAEYSHRNSDNCGNLLRQNSLAEVVDNFIEANRKVFQKDISAPNAKYRFHSIKTSISWAGPLTWDVSVYIYCTSVHQRRYILLNFIGAQESIPPSLCSLAGRYDNPIPTRFLYCMYSPHRLF